MSFRQMLMSSSLPLRAPDGVEGGGDTGGDAAAAAAAAAAAGDKSWTEGLASEIVGFAQSKGWDKLPPAEAAAQAIGSYREAQGFIGADPKSLVRLPKDASDEAGYAALWERLGVPKEAKDYDFGEVKIGDEPAPADWLDWARNTALSLHLPKDQAPAFAQALAKQMNDAATAQAAETTAALQAERDELTKNWGQNFEANKFIAKQGAAKLGLDEKAVDALEKVTGYAKTMEALRRVGVMSGEANFVSGDGKGNGVMTRDQAIARKAELEQDTAWVKSYLDGDVAKGREMLALNTIIVNTASAG